MVSSVKGSGHEEKAKALSHLQEETNLGAGRCERPRPRVQALLPQTRVARAKSTGKGAELPQTLASTLYFDRPT